MEEDEPQGPQRGIPEFFLTPLNRAAKQATADALNADYCYEQDGGLRVLYISFADPHKLEYTLGCSGADIYLANLKGADISREQCAFILDPDTGAVFLQDRSNRNNTETLPSAYGKTTIALPEESPLEGISPMVLVARGINTRIGLGRERYYQFEIIWHNDGLYAFPNEGLLPTGPRRGRKRYVQGERIGGGAFGNVYRVLDVFTGKPFAVKKFHTLEGKTREFAKREINNLFRINRSKYIQHTHILEILDFAGLRENDKWGEIFMPLKEGSLKSLVNSEFSDLDIPALADRVLNQMLQALRTIARHKIIHRNIKPENILYETTPTGYHFQLGGFTASNNLDSAITMVGTEAFMAPEVWHRKRQTTKLDIWSLFATIIWVRNVQGFRTECSKFNPPDIHDWIMRIAKEEPVFARIKGMANWDAEKRPSAKDLLKPPAEEPSAEAGDNALNKGVGKPAMQPQQQDEDEGVDADESEDFDEFGITIGAGNYVYKPGENSNEVYSGIPKGYGVTPEDEMELGERSTEVDHSTTSRFIPETTEKSNSGTSHKIRAGDRFDREAEDEDRSVGVESKIQTDSGYHSATTKSATAQTGEEGDDSATVYSDFSNMSDSKTDNYVSELAADLFSKLPMESTTLNRVASILADRLGEFALKVGHQAPSQMHRDVMAFIHRYRHDIAQAFKESCEDYGEETRPRRPASDKMSVAELMEMWVQSTKYDELLTNPPEDDPSEEEDDLEEPETTDLLAYRELIFESQAYRWLVTTLRREFYISTADPDAMAHIRTTVLQCLPPTRRVSRKVSPETYTVSFHASWDALKFFTEQEYGISPEEALLCALTLTAASDSYAQCLPCLNYFRQMWPVTGEGFINFISSVVGNPSAANKCLLPDKTLLTSPGLDASSFVVTANGTTESLAEIAEQLGWLVTAFAASPVDRGVTYYRPVVSQRPPELTTADPSVFEFDVRYDIHLPNHNFTQDNGQCWHELFQNPVAVYGYPILRRSQPQPGLEIPLNMIAALLDEQRVNIFRNRVYIKGFNAMLVPTKRIDSLLIWHLLLNEDESHISYLDGMSVETDENIRLADLETHRHVVGWCSNAAYHAGASGIGCEVERSRLPKPHAGCFLDKCSISGGQFVTAGLSFALGIRDKSIRITRTGYIRRLEWISKKFVVFWDEGEKRGWLVNGTSALLHLVRASLEHNRQSKFRSTYVFNPKDLAEASITHAPESSLHVLRNKKNRQLKIYDDDEDLEDEDEDTKTSLKGEGPGGEKSYLRFQDRVSVLFETLEKIIDNEISASEERGVSLKVRARKHLEGWDFKDLATDNDPFYPRVAVLGVNGKGWVDFTRSIHAITLFGKGFGDIIRPTANSGLCDHWATLPHGRYYLAAAFQDLKEIAELHGDPNSSPMRLTDCIVWHNPGPDRCRCQNQGRNERPNKLQKRQGIGKHSDFAQVLLPANSSEKKYRRAGPFEAFVFGHNVNYSWRYGDHGDPAPAPPPEPEPGVEVLSDTASSVEAASSATTSIFSPNLSGTTETSLAQLSEERPSGSVKQAHSAPESDEDDRGGSVTEATSIGLAHSLHIHNNAPFIYTPSRPGLRHERRSLTLRSSSPYSEDNKEVEHFDDLRTAAWRG